MAINTSAVFFAEDDNGNFSDLKQSAGSGLRVSIKEHETDTPIRPLTGFKTSQTTITSSAAEVLSSPLALRKTVAIKNYSTGVLFFGHISGMTTTDGFPLASSESSILEVDANTRIWMMSDGTFSGRAAFIEIA